MYFFNHTHIKSLLSKLLIIFLGTFFLTECVIDEETDIIPNKKDAVYINLKLDVPAQSLPIRTRNTKQNKIDETALNNLKVLVFNKEKNTEVFEYEAEYTTEDQKNLIIKLKKTDAVITLALLANYNLQLPNAGTSIENFKKALIYEAPIITDQGIPMWREQKGLIVTQNMTTEIRLTRATARIDVLINPAKTDGTFTLQEVQVFNANSKGYVATTATLPFVPLDQEKKEQTYTATNNTVENQIYIAESFKEEADKHLYLVIKGIYEKSECYYRLDILETESKEKKEHCPILRNHLYQLKITDIKGKGWSTLEEAKNNGTSHDVEYNVKTWNEGITDMWTHNEYYFGVSSKGIKIQGKAGSTAYLEYQTNIKDFSLKWKDNGANYFMVENDEPNSKLKFTAKQNNIDVSLIVPVCTLTIVKSDWFEYDIPISQDILADYATNCESTTFGTYVVGEETTDEHYIQVVVNVDADAIGNHYLISSNEVNGLRFNAEGKFKSQGKTNIKLMAEGIPQEIGNHDYTITYNNFNQTQCKTAIQVYVKRNITFKIHNDDDTSIERVPFETELYPDAGDYIFKMHSDGVCLFYTNDKKTNQKENIWCHSIRSFQEISGVFNYTFKSPFTVKEIVENPNKPIELRIEKISGLAFTYGLEPTTGLGSFLTPAKHRITQDILSLEILKNITGHNFDINLHTTDCEFTINNYYDDNIEDSSIKLSFHAASKYQRELTPPTTYNKETYVKGFTIREIKSGIFDFSGKKNLTQLNLRRRFKHRVILGIIYLDCDMRRIDKDARRYNINGENDNHYTDENSYKIEHAHYAGGGDKKGYNSFLINYSIKNTKTGELVLIDANEKFTFEYYSYNTTLTLIEILGMEEIKLD